MNSRTVELDIGGMTCASCVRHVTSSLQAVPGVSASVNLATERATIVAPFDVATDDLIRAVKSAGYQASQRGHAASSDALQFTLGQRLSFATVLTVPVLALSMVPVWQFDYWQFMAFLLATPVVWWAGWPFHRAAVSGIRHARFSMDTLVSVGTISAWAWSTWAIMFGHAAMIGMRHEWALLPSGPDPSANIYFETAVVLITVILLGRWLEDSSKRTAGAALRALAELLPQHVRVLRERAANPMDLLAPSREEQSIARGELGVGDLVVVLPGETIPVDGTVRDGASAVDMSSINGESSPTAVIPGMAVVAGTLACDGRLVIQAERVGDDTRIAQLTALVDRAQVARSSVQAFADRISAVFVPVVLGLALVTGLTWWLFSSDIGLAFGIAVSVIVIACPCALGLATPVAIMAGTGRGAQLGIVISGPEAIERSGRIRTVFLDKTGTVTTGRLHLVRFEVDGVDEATAWELLAAIERGSTHPIAAAVSRTAAQRNIPVRPLDDLAVQPGVGASGVRDGVSVQAIAVHSWTGELPARLNIASAETAVLLVRAGIPIAIATFADTVKTDAALAISELERLGVQPFLLSGDRTEVVERVADELGIAQRAGERSPQEKWDAVTQARARGAVAMVGDGINDAAALAAADLGIAIGSGTDLARAASDITVLRDDALVIPQALRLARATRRVILGNLVWAFGYNVAAIPLAMSGLLGPMIAGAAMAFSSVFVVLNSIRLTRFR